MVSFSLLFCFFVNSIMFARQAAPCLGRVVCCFCCGVLPGLVVFDFSGWDEALACLDPHIFTKHSNNSHPASRPFQEAARTTAGGFPPRCVEIAALSPDFSRRFFCTLVILLVNAVVQKYVVSKRKGKKNHKVCHKHKLWL